MARWNTESNQISGVDETGEHLMVDCHGVDCPVHSGDELVLDKKVFRVDYPIGDSTTDGGHVLLNNRLFKKSKVVTGKLNQ